MPKPVIQSSSPAELRLRAISQLTGRSGSGGAPVDASTALGVLHELASSPATAARALALLHELQVYQVELELQAEELRNARTELEASHQRQAQVYDCSPASHFTVDHNTTLCELNLTGARLLGGERDALVGRSFDSFLTPASRDALRALLARAGESRQATGGTLEVSGHDSIAVRAVHVSVGVDPAGPHFLIAAVEKA
jgi:PAS domain S-box-containing protein